METAKPAELKSVFGRMGLSMQELLALCGAHTLGSKGFGDPLTFDNEYYRILLRRPWKSGQEMDLMIGANPHVFWSLPRLCE